MVRGTLLKMLWGHNGEGLPTRSLNRIFCGTPPLSSLANTAVEVVISMRLIEFFVGVLAEEAMQNSNRVHISIEEIIQNTP